MLGHGALVLFIGLAEGTDGAHDDWHTHEHFPERLSIPGFLRASRWKGTAGYFVLYEVQDVGVLTSAAYMERLNHPSAWTQEVMKSYRGMRRGLCRLESSFGFGLGRHAVVVRHEAPLQGVDLAGLVQKPGIGSAGVYASAAEPQMTAEQRIRGQDQAVDRVLVVTAYDDAALAGLRFPDEAAMYRLEYVATAADVRG